MRPVLLLTSFFFLAATGNASWFNGDDKPEYETWDTQKLHHWLESNSIDTPDSYGQKDLKKLVAANWESHKPWTQEHYDAAKARFDGVQASAFESWDESKLRNFLLEQGVVEPHGPKEQMVLAAKKQYNQYTAAAVSLASQASAAASTAVYGDSKYQASKSASSVASWASNSATSAASVASVTATAAYNDASRSAAAAYATAAAFASRKLDDTTDYIYSTWDDNQLRTYLEKKGLIKTKQQATRDELLAKMRGAYVSATDPAYNAWSDSYLKAWLVAHGIIKSDYERKRDEYVALMKSYYYGPQDRVWSTWSDSDAKAWLVKNGYIKSDAQIQREKMNALIAKNYYNAKDTVYSAWDDISMKNWLIDHGYMRSDAQVKRDELVKSMHNHYTSTSDRASEYLTWPDARLRAYLRAHNVDDSKFIGRPSLLQEVRIRWYQSVNGVESIIQSIRDTINAGVGTAEAKLAQILEMLGAKTDEGKAYANEKARDASGYASDKTLEAKKYAATQAADKAKSAENAAKSARKEAERQKKEL